MSKPKAKPAPDVLAGYNQNLTQFEKERAARIAENKRRMAELFKDVQTDLLV
jgi:hypothetical protein